MCRKIASYTFIMCLCLVVQLSDTQTVDFKKTTKQQVARHANSTRQLPLDVSRSLDESEPQQQVLGELTINGSAILDDLVNQFLEKNREAVRQGSEHTLNVHIEPQVAEIATNPSDDSIDSELSPTAMPLVHVVAVTPESNSVGEDLVISSELNVDPELADRYIQYDTAQPEKLSNIKLIESNSRDIAQLSESSGFTLSPIKVRSDDDSIPLLTNQTLNQTEPSRANTSAIQARSIGSLSLLNVQNRGHQLSRAPYATYNQFNQEESGASPKSAASTKDDNPAMDAPQQDQPSLLNSIKRISTHLNDDLASADEIPKDSANLEKQLQKLGQVNQLVHLDPLNKTLSSNSSQAAEPAPSRIGQNDRYASPDSDMTFRHTAHGSKDGAPDSRHHESSPTLYLHKKTLDSVSNQLQHSANGQLEQNSIDLNLLAHKNVPQPGHHAASLINITAPITLPMSATEAMESTLTGSKDLIHQVSGLVRQREHPSSTSTTTTTTSKPSPKKNPSNFSSFNDTSSSGFLMDQYSAPANELQTYSAAADFADKDKFRVRNSNSGRLGNNGGSSVSPMHQASGFRAPNHHHHSGHHFANQASNSWPLNSLMAPSNYLSGSNLAAAAPSSSQANPTSQIPPSVHTDVRVSTTTTTTSTTSNPATISMSQTRAPALSPAGNGGSSVATTNGFITSTGQGAQTGTEVHLGGGGPVDGSGNNPLKRALNLTRVEHISAECSNDLIRTIIVFNGTFKGIIYSSGYVRDLNCIYINGTGQTRYDFSIRLNQCGTLGRQEVHAASKANELRRRDQVMWNTLTIQYNSMIEQEWDEHFRVSCEYGSDFWKTVSFSPFSVETNTGSPVVFTVDPPHCQMEVLRGHGMVGPRQEAVSGPVTVGDPLTLLIHMRSERAGYDILVKNCIAHNGGHQKMQLIDVNGCVVNERFMSPFRGTYNDNDLKHVTLFSYLKAFRFTGSPVLYIECEIHMCQSSCPPQMCYWRRLSKRSSLNDSQSWPASEDFELGDSNYVTTASAILSDTTETPTTPLPGGSKRRSRTMNLETSRRPNLNPTAKRKPKENQESNISLLQAIEVQERQPDALSSRSSRDHNDENPFSDLDETTNLACYRRAEVLAFMLTVGLTLIVAIMVTICCWWRAARLKASIMSAQWK